MGRTIWRSLAANVSLTVGVVGGVKVADFILWDKEKYDAMQERLELDYWKKYGTPENIEGHLHKSGVNPGEFYMSYLKEKNPHTNLEDRVYKTMWATNK